MTATETAPPPVASPEANGSRRGPGALVVGAVLWALAVAPLVVALAAISSPRWFPIADLAQTELRVRDVGTSNTPIIGLAGRIGEFQDPGSHPGPLSFWLLAPVYRLFGGSSFGLATSVVVLHATAMALALWIAARRGGVHLVAAVGAGQVLLVHSFGAQLYFEPWNPYLPVSWWLVFLLAVWSVADDDLPMLPIAVGAGSMCAQTHLPYLGLVGGFGAFVGVVLVVALRSQRRGPDRAGLARSRRWVLASAVLGAALWTPTVIDQVAGTGNLTKIVESFTGETDEPAVGLVRGGQQVLHTLDPLWLVRGTDPSGASFETGWNLTAALLVVAWAGSMAVAWRIGHRRLFRLHVVLTISLVLGLVSASRIYGVLWHYLFLWLGAISMLMVVATAWTLLSAARGRVAPTVRRRVGTMVLPTVALVALAASVAASVDNLDAEPARADLGGVLGDLSADTVASLDSGELLGGGRDGRYLVRWADPVTIGSQGIGLLNELDRAGFDVGVDESFGVGATRHRVLDTADATALVQLATGSAIPAWEARDDATRVAYVDRRTDAQRAEFDRLEASVGERLLAIGRDDLAAEWEANLFTASLDTDVPDDVRDDMIRVLDLGVPAAVYLAPPPEP